MHNELLFEKSEFGIKQFESQCSFCSVCILVTKIKHRAGFWLSDNNRSPPLRNKK